MADRLDPTLVRAHIEALRVAYPEISQDEEAWLLTLESETELHEFLTRVVRRMLETKANIGGIGQYICELKVRQDRLDQRVEAMRSLMFKLMDAARLKKLELAPATLSIRGGQPRVIVTDETALPADCVRIKREPDKHLIASYLKAGQEVPGATLSNSEETLAVRVK